MKRHFGFPCNTRFLFLVVPVQHAVNIHHKNFSWSKDKKPNLQNWMSHRKPKHCTDKVSRSQGETAFFLWDNCSSSQTPDIYLTLFEASHPCHRGNSLGYEASTEAFKFHPQISKVKQKPTQAPSNAPVCNMQEVQEMLCKLMVRTTTTFLSKSSSLMSQWPTTHRFTQNLLFPPISFMI